MRTQVTIKFKENTGTSLEFRDLELPSASNVSKVKSILNNTSRGARGFQLSKRRGEPVSTLDGSYGYFASDGYAGYLSSEICGATGSFSTALELDFYVAGNRPDYLYVVFDTVAQEYATRFMLRSPSVTLSVSNNTSVICRLPVRSLNMPTTGEGIVMTLVINKWSKPYKSAKVTLISKNFVGVFVGSDLKSVACSENTLDEQMSLSPGIIAQYADISLYDRQGFIHRLAEEGALLQEADVAVEAVDDDGTTHALGTYLVSTWDVPATSSTVSVDCTDVTATLERLDVPQQPVEDRTLHDMLTLLFQYIRNASWMYYDDETEKYCKRIMTPDSWFKAESVYVLLNKICSLGMLRIYWQVNTYVVARCI